MILLDDLQVEPTVQGSPVPLSSLTFSGKVLLPRGEGIKPHPLAGVKAIFARQTPSGVEMLVIPAADARPWVVAEAAVTCSAKMREHYGADSAGRLLLSLCTKMGTDLLTDRATLDYLAGHPPAEALYMDEISTRAVAALRGEIVPSAPVAAPPVPAAPMPTAPAPQPSAPMVAPPQPAPPVPAAPTSFSAQPTNPVDLPPSFLFCGVLYWLSEMGRLYYFRRSLWSSGHVDGLGGLKVLDLVVVAAVTLLLVYLFTAFRTGERDAVRLLRRIFDYLSSYALFHTLMYWTILSMNGIETIGYWTDGIWLSVRNAVLFFGCTYALSRWLRSSTGTWDLSR